VNDSSNSAGQIFTNNYYLFLVDHQYFSIFGVFNKQDEKHSLIVSLLRSCYMTNEKFSADLECVIFNRN